MMTANFDPQGVWLLHADMSSEAANLSRRVTHLSNEEVAQANRFRTVDRQRAFVVGRGLVREFLGSVLETPPRAVPLSVQPGGKPVLRSGQSTAHWHFNVSHSQDLVVVALTQLGEVGIDVECRQREIATDVLMRGYFSRQECEEYRRLASHLRVESALRGWTRKEATWKMLGGKVRVALQQIAVSLIDTSWTTVNVLPAADRAPLTETCLTWNPAADYIASAVVASAVHWEPRFPAIQLHLASDGDLSELLRQKMRSP